MRSIAIVAGLLLPGAGLFAADSPADRLKDAAAVFHEITSTPDKGIPQDLLDRAHCVVIIPGLKKAAFGVGGEFGRGFVTCRKANGSGWGDPAAVRMEGGSFGFQIGGSSTDLVMLVMNRRGMDKLLQSKFTLGADASVAAGPVGRTANASTDAYMTAEILAWSRAKGLFAGIALNGATLRPDSDVNKQIYGRAMDNREVLTSTAPAPADARPLIAELDRASMTEKPSEADRSADRTTDTTTKHK